MYITSNSGNPFYVYQFLAAGDDSNNDDESLAFRVVPPLSCDWPQEVNEIPEIHELTLNADIFTGNLSITTLAGTTINVPGVTLMGPRAAAGNPMWETYYAEEINRDDLSVSANGPIAVAFHQTTSDAETGRVSGSGYYSGFTLEPSTTGGAAKPVDICQNGGTVNLVTEAGLPTGGTWSPALDSGTNISVSYTHLTLPTICSV